jgi:hypothetical protein
VQSIKHVHTMNAAELINVSIECWNAYNPHKQTIESHCDAFIKNNSFDAATAEFLREICYGIDRYQKLLEITVNGLYDYSINSAARSDRIRYIVLSYLILIRGAELTEAEINSLINSQQLNVASSITDYLFNEELLKIRDSVLDAAKHLLNSAASKNNAEEDSKSHISQAEEDNPFPGIEYGYLVQLWSSIYSIDYLKDKFLPQLLQTKTKLHKTLVSLTSRLHHSTKFSQSQSPELATPEHCEPSNYTVPEPFNLTQSKPRLLPRPEIIHASITANPVPSTTYETNLLLRAEEARRAKAQRNKEELHAKYSIAKPFPLQTALRPSNLPRIMAEINAEERENCQLFVAKPAPDFSSLSSPFKPSKPTVTHILRNEMLLRRLEADKTKELQLLQLNLIDENQYNQWKLAQHQAAEAEKAKQIEQRKLENEISAKNYAESVEKAKEVKSKSAKINKIQAKEAERQLKLAKEEEIQEKQAAAKVIQAELNIIPAKTKRIVAENNQIKALEVAREAETIKLAVEQQKQRDLAQKRALIHEIQAMEKLAAARAKERKIFDPTTTAQQGLLEELSLAELQAKLSYVKQREMEFIKRKNANIRAKQAEKQQILHKLEQKHAVFHEKLIKTAQTERGQRKSSKISAETAEKQRLVGERREFEAHQAVKQENKVAEALQLAEERRKANLLKLNYAAQRELAQTHQNSDLLQGQVRFAAAENVRRELEKQREAHIMGVESLNHGKLVGAAQRQKRENHKKLEKKWQKEKEEAKEMQSFEEKILKEQREAIYHREKKVLEVLKQRNPANFIVYSGGDSAKKEKKEKQQKKGENLGETLQKSQNERTELTLDLARTMERSFVATLSALPAAQRA